MKFSDLTGHKEIINALRKMADKRRVPHALLFSGISGIGKMRTARAFAQYLHCKNPQNGDPCGRCPSCVQHQNHNNPDLHFVYPIVKKEPVQISKDLISEWKEMLDNFSYMPPEKWNEIIKAGNSQPSIYVAESAEILNRASLSAYQEDLKIFIIWLPEKLRPEAANKLLKIIEEPFEDTVFILVSNEDSKILPTILSRTQRFNFRPIAKEVIFDSLIARGVDSTIAKDASNISGGSMGKGEELATRPEELDQFLDYFKVIMRAAYGLKAKELKDASEEIASWGREKIIRFLSYMQRMMRENFISNVKVESLVEMTANESSFSQKFSPFIHHGNIENIINELHRASSDIERNANAKIVLFDLFLLLSRFVRIPVTSDFP